MNEGKMSTSAAKSSVAGQVERELKSMVQDSEEFREGEPPAERELLEWGFIDFSKTERCPVFDVDPVMLKKFVGRHVTVYNTSREEFHGCCLAIDPVSLSVILARRNPDGKIRIITLPGYHLAKIYENPNCIPEEARVTVNDLDLTELYSAPSLLPSASAKIFESLPNDDDIEVQGNNDNADGAPINTSPQYTDADIKNRKDNLRALLTKHKMPFTENGEVFQLPGGIQIQPPYTLESCDTKGNQMIKKKIGELMKSL